MDNRKMTKTIENFLKYARIDTRSEEESQTTPSTMKQHHLAEVLAEQLTEMGATEITYDKEHCYVYASVPASEGCEEAPVLGLIAHMDTSPDAPGENVKPQIHENYDGGDVVLPGTGAVLSTKQFPFLAKLKGQTLITTDGTTLLGADDKAGVSEIMTAVETGSSLDREMIANFPAMLPGLAFQTYIRKNIDVKKAPLALQPLCFFSPRCTATGDYAALCDEMLARMEG